MNILEEYGFLTREEYETYCFQVQPAGMQVAKEDGSAISHGVEWAVQDVDKAYSKTFAKAKVELRQRGLDPGNADYGLVRVIESGEVRPAGDMWKKSDIDLAMISLAELGCIEPWVHACKCFNIRPVAYVQALRAAAESNIDRLGQYADEPLFYRYEFAFGESLIVPGLVTITLRDDWERIIRRTSEGPTDAAEER